MLHIILFILKIIGIILLCILGVVLLAICCALFVPLRYRIEVCREEGGGKPPVIVRAKVTWLLHLVNVLICYPADVYVRARVFLFTLFRLPKKERDKKKDGRQDNQEKKKKKKPRQTDTGRDERPEQADEAPAGEEQDASSESGAEDRVTRAAASAEDTDGRPDSGSGIKESQVSGQETVGLIGKIVIRIHDFVDKIKQIIEKIKAAVENIQYTIRRLCDKIKSVLDNIQYYREVTESDAFQQSWKLCRKQVGVIARELKPDKIKADLVIGMEDPAATGEILAVCGMLYPFMGQNVRISGDFERAHIEGWVYIKGKIRAFTFLRAAVKVYMNKDVKALIKLLKKEAV